MHLIGDQMGLGVRSVLRYAADGLCCACAECCARLLTVEGLGPHSLANSKLRIRNCARTARMQAAARVGHQRTSLEDERICRLAGNDGRRRPMSDVIGR